MEHSQTLEHPQSEKDDGGEQQLVLHEVDDEKQLPISQPQIVSHPYHEPLETLLSITEVVVRSTSQKDYQSEEVEEEVVDDEITDPTWECGKPSEDSSTEGEGSAAPQQAGRGSGMAKRRRRATPKGSTTVPRRSPLRQSPLPWGSCSAAWCFFKESADDKRIVICNLRRTKMSRGVNTSNRHMASKHPNKWAERLHESSATTSTFLSQSSVQMSITQAFEHKRK